MEVGVRHIALFFKLKTQMATLYPFLVGSRLEEETKRVQDWLRPFLDKQEEEKETQLPKAQYLILCPQFLDLVHVLRYLDSHNISCALVHGFLYQLENKPVYLTTTCHPLKHQSWMQTAIALVRPEQCVVLGTATSSTESKLGQIVVGTTLTTMTSAFAGADPISFEATFLKTQLPLEDKLVYDNKVQKAVENIAAVGWELISKDGLDRETYDGWFETKQMVVEGNILEETEDIEGGRVETYLSCFEKFGIDCFVRNDNAGAYDVQDQKILHVRVLTRLPNPKTQASLQKVWCISLLFFNTDFFL